MTATKYTFLLYLYWLILVIPTHALSQSWSVQHFDTEDGLPGNITYSILQDKDGYIWIPTNNGLCRYDGIEFKLYDSPLIANNEILGCGEAMGMIWFYTFGGNLFYIENDEVKRFEQVTGETIMDLIDVNDNTILIASEGEKKQSYKIQRIKRTGNDWSVKSQGLEHTDRASNTFGKIDNQVYIVSCGDIFRYDNIKDSLIHVFLQHVPPDFCPGFNSTLKDKISYYNGRMLHIFDGETCDSTNFITDSKSYIFEDGKGKYWFTGDKPLLADSLTDTSPTELSELLDGSLCNEITEDNEGNIWFSTNSNGIYVLYNTPFLNYTSENSNLPNDHVYDIDGDAEGNVFIATKGGMLTAMMGKRIVDNEQILNSSREIYDVKVTEDDKILVIQKRPYLFRFDTINNKLKNEGIISYHNTKRFIETPDNSIVAGGRYVTIINNFITATYYSIGQKIRIYAGIKLSDSFLLGSNMGVFHLPNDAFNKIDETELVSADILIDTFFKVSTSTILEKHQFEHGEVINDYIGDMKYAQDGSIWIASRKIA